MSISRHVLFDRWSIVSSAVAVAVLATASGCGSPSSPSVSPTALVEDAPAAQPVEEIAVSITIGDIDPDEPAKKIKRFTPLAKYLAENLAAFGIEKGSVVVARDIEEMATFLKDRKVDVYMDSAFPILASQEMSGAEIILRRWKSSDPTYSSTFIALRGGDISKVEDFVGKVVAFEEPHSTSGFVLPAGTLAQRGFSLHEVETPDAKVANDKIGYLFSRDEENTVRMILDGKVAGGGVSNQDYAKLSPEVALQLIAFDGTIAVPRQLVLVRQGLDSRLVDRIEELLVGLDRTEEGRELLHGIKKTKKFDPVPPDSQRALGELRTLMRLVAED